MPSLEDLPSDTTSRSNNYYSDSFKNKFNVISDEVIDWAIKHPIISMVLILTPFLLLYPPAAKNIFSINGLLTIPLVFFDAGIIFFFSISDVNDNFSFKAAIDVSIPIVIVFMVANSVGPILRYSITFMISVILLAFVMPSTDFRKSFVVSLFILLIDFAIIFGIGQLI
jgi:hypothetical protein